MLCRKVANHINSHMPLDKRLKDHIAGCAECRKALEAEEFLQSLLDSEKQAIPLAVTNFESLRQKAEAQLNNKAIEERSIMSELKHRVMKYPKLSFGVGLVTVAVLVLLTPFSYDTGGSYNLSFNTAIAGDDLPLEYLDSIADSLGYAEAVVGVASTLSDKIYFINNLPDESAANEFALVLSSDSLGNKSGVLLRDHGKFGVLVLGGDNNVIRLNAKGKTGDEVAEEIKKQLAKAGYGNADVKVVVRDDDLKDIIINLSNSTLASGANAMLEIMTFGDNIMFSLPDDHLVILNNDLENKPDSIVIDEISKQLKDRGNKNPDIKIKTDKEGKRKIIIKPDKK